MQLRLTPAGFRPPPLACPTDNGSVLSNLTYGLILNPIGAGLSALAALFGLLGVFSTSRAATILMTIASLLALVVTGVSFILSMVLFGLARNRLNDAGADAMFGNGQWMILGAFVSLVRPCPPLCRPPLPLQSRR